MYDVNRFSGSPRHGADQAGLGLARRGKAWQGTAWRAPARLGKARITTMPIIRTFGCLNCGHIMEQWLTLEQADDEPPDCPECATRTQQQFVPFGITGSNNARAHDIAESIISTDYHAADFQREHRREGTPSVRYKDQNSRAENSSWSGVNAALEQAVAIGRQTRQRYGGNGLDILQANLKSGVEPDLIANSKRKSIKVW